MEKIKEKLNFKVILIILCFCMTIPSCLYLIKGNSIANLTSDFSFFIHSSKQILTTQKIIDTILFMGLWLGISVLYFYGIKHHEAIFPTWKSVVMVIIIVSILFMMILPMTSTDVFYYIGTGWSQAHYGVNPYDTSVDELMLQKEQAGQDPMLLKMKGIWSNQTVVYGPIWTFVCNVLSYLSFGSLGLALFLYKLFNLLFHFANVYLVYKITNQSKKYTLMYALNPLILFECLSNAHNEMLVIFFMLIAIYYLITKKRLLPAVLFLACATAVKYFAILLAPFFVLYYYQKEKLAKKIGYSVLWAILFVIILIVFYSVYMRDLNVLQGIFTQQSKFTNSIFMIIAVRNFKLATLVSQGFMIAYMGIFAIEILKILFCKKEYSWKQMMQKYNTLLVLFIFSTITNLQPWYLLWILPTVFWQTEKTQNILLKMTSIAVLATSIYFLFNEFYIYGQYYIAIFAILTLAVGIWQKKHTIQE